MEEGIPVRAVMVAVLVLVGGGGLGGTVIGGEPVSARTAGDGGPAGYAPTAVNGTTPAVGNGSTPAVGNGSTPAAGNASLGRAVTAFMHATDAEAAATVDDGLFAVQFRESNASRRAQLVRHRAAALQARLDDLRQERRELHNATATGSVTIAEHARAASLAARIGTLRRAVDRTATMARQTGIPFDDTELDSLRNETRGLQSDEVPGLTPGLGNRTGSNRSVPPDVDRTPGRVAIPNRTGNDSNPGR